MNSCQLMSEANNTYILALFAVSILIAVWALVIPKPNNKRKKQANIFVVLFSVCCNITYSLLLLKSCLNPALALFAAILFFTLASYCILIAIHCRYDEKINFTTYLAYLFHIFIAAASVTLLYQLDVPETQRSFLTLIHVSIPLILSIRRVNKRVRHDGGAGDRSLLGSIYLSITFLTLLVILRFFLDVVSSPLVLEIVFLAFLVFQLLLAGGFSVSLFHSIVRKLNQQIVTDSLTGLKNRSYFYQTVPKVLAILERQYQPACLMMADIDDFKQINDKYGHGVGDMALVELASTLVNTVRDEDIIIRMGGEEFLVFFINSDIEAATMGANRVLNAIRDILIEFGDGDLLNLTASLGLTEYRPHLSVDENIKRADDALYQAKKNGKNQIYSW